MKGLRDGIGRNQAFQIEAMRFSLRAAEFSFERVIGTAKYLEDISQVPDFLRVFALVTDCWSVVDTIKRSREILLHVSGLKRKTDWVQDFLKATSAIEPFRNIMQHIAVTSRKVIWLFSEQLRLHFVPVLHRLQGCLAAEG